MVRHISNHSSKSTFETELCQRHYLSHKSMKNSYFGDMLMSKTLSKSQLYLSHHSTSNSNFWDKIMSKTLFKSQTFIRHILKHFLSNNYV